MLNCHLTIKTDNHTIVSTYKEKQTTGHLVWTDKPPHPEINALPNGTREVTLVQPTHEVRVYKKPTLSQIQHCFARLLILAITGAKGDGGLKIPRSQVRSLINLSGHRFKYADEIKSSLSALKMRLEPLRDKSGSMIQKLYKNLSRAIMMPTIMTNEVTRHNADVMADTLDIIKTEEYYRPNSTFPDVMTKEDFATPFDIFGDALAKNGLKDVRNVPDEDKIIVDDHYRGHKLTGNDLIKRIDGIFYYLE